MPDLAEAKEIAAEWLEEGSTKDTVSWLLDAVGKEGALRVLRTIQSDQERMLVDFRRDYGVQSEEVRDTTTSLTRTNRAIAFLKALKS